MSSELKISPHLLRIDASYSYRTYDGCYEGVPAPKLVIQAAKRHAKELWDERPTLVIEASTNSKNMLPTWTNIVWASGPAKYEEMDGSHLVIIWWSEMGPDTHRVLDAVDWNKHAQDFQV